MNHILNIPLQTEFCQYLLETVCTPWRPAHKGNMHPWGGGECVIAQFPMYWMSQYKKTLHNQIFKQVVLCVLRVNGFTLHRNRGYVEWLLQVCEMHIRTMIETTSEISKVVSFLLKTSKRRIVRETCRNGNEKSSTEAKVQLSTRLLGRLL